MFPEYVLPKNTTGGQFLHGMNDSLDTVTARSNYRRRSVKKVFLEISQNSLENKGDRDSFLGVLL